MQRTMYICRAVRFECIKRAERDKRYVHTVIPNSQPCELGSIKSGWGVGMKENGAPDTDDTSWHIVDFHVRAMCVYMPQTMLETWKLP